MASDSVTSLLRDIVKWLDAHDDVLPKLHKEPTPAQQEEAALRKKYKNYLERNGNLTREQRKLQQEIDRRKTDRVDLDNIKLITNWSAQHSGRLPIQSKDDAEEYTLANRLRRLEAKERKSPMLQMRLAQLQETAPHSPTKASKRGAKEKNTKRQAAAFLQRIKEEHEEWCGLHFSSQERSKRPPELQEKYPYPGLVNLGNTCYLNAVCQVLFHCDAARNFLRSGVEVPEVSPASVANDDSTHLLQELQSLAQKFADGFPTELLGQRCRIDCWSPHYLIDVFLRCRPLKLGEQHDAREALEEILMRTRLGKELFDTGAEGVQRSDIVSLPAFAEDGWWYQKFTSEHQVIRMRELLADGFSHLHEKLLVPPPVLAMVLPPVALGESDTSLWLNGTSREPLLRADWGNYTLDLAVHFSAHGSGGEQAVYKLAGHIAYEGDVDVTPNWVL